ncbi:Putative splicing factor 3b, subunit 1, SF3b1 [Chondrus crispus]|uniref:Putative splicing factor 3b, subunit 1, SF3b1 n=1 Tax=Chondrus crispus TaxID=2769 RepID=R7Q2G9_CHOCR|nr:Putative splicing factor 3b, subunit 1, SF3b1 [Chondrus crispus]CDF32068.1 Putative splicing factor 3b, subunit 1, SF3b1 [Chondrus crispus]|eukprot:XP_005711733.1 Putative splicing factor 3b, subunit 1, SF3b1 [Chondrus crispus]
MSKQPARSDAVASERVAFGTGASGYDADLYDDLGPKSQRQGYVTSIDPVTNSADDQDALQVAQQHAIDPRSFPITAPRHLIDEAEAAAAVLHTDDPFKPYVPKTIAEQENSYLAGRRKRLQTAEKGEAAERMKQRICEREEAQRIQSGASADDKGNTANPSQSTHVSSALNSSSATELPKPRQKRRRRWDVTPEIVAEEVQGQAPFVAPESMMDLAVPVEDSLPPSAERPPTVPAVPVRTSRWDAPASATQPLSRSRWDATPASMSTTQGPAKRSRWDRTPNVQSASIFQTPMTKTGSAILDTPMLGNGSLAPELLHASRWQADIDIRNKPFTDEELDRMLPSDGYTILEAPESYKPIQTPARKLLATPVMSEPSVYVMPAEGGMSREGLGIPAEMPEALRGLDMKPEDYTNFASILDKNAGDDDIPEEQRVERRIMRLLLKIKNGAPSVRKVAMRQISEKARDFGPARLFNQILPLLMSPTLEHQERHLYVKVIDRILYKLDNLVRPHVHKILVVIEPMLIDDDYYARVEGREIISNLAKAAGLPTMISTMRPDIDHQDEFVRNTTARAFAVVTSALGIPSMLKFLKAVCRSKKTWEARHTGTKVVQQIAILMGVAVLPHLRELVEIIEIGLTDEQGKVRLITAFALAALAEASAPYGIESFDSVLKPLWQGIRLHKGKTLGAFLKAIGFIIPLMDPEYANYYAREVTTILIREFRSPEEEMKVIVLKVVMQCVSCSGVEPKYVREEIVPEYFRCFWIRRMALDRRNFRAVVDTTLQIAIKIGGGDVIARLTDDLKDESDPYRRMVVETIEKVTEKLGLSDVDKGLESRLIDGLLYAFQAQGHSNESGGVLRALSIVVERLGIRAKSYLEQIIGIVKWRLNNPSTRIREHAADLISRIAAVMKACDEEPLMAHMGTVLFEYLGEEFPDVLGSILRAMKAIVEEIGIDQMQPPVNELLPRLTPILKNRHEKVQENCILVVGRIASKGAHFVSAKEWMRICFELLELLKAPRKAIRKSAVSTFGFIAKAIGPSNVLTTLLNNLKVQERTQRVCTTVAIAIVAETCEPYTVLPSLMNEYRIPELHVQNGILKSLSFLFEYIRHMAGDYIYAVTPILEDALIDRDLVHRQTACSAVGHLALGVRGLGAEDALTHLLNHVWPNIFETSPHVINAVMFAIQGLTAALGPGLMLLYVLQGLFHPARKVREVYWRIYNRLYIYAQEGLVPFYPSMRCALLEEDDDEYGPERYERSELLNII